MNNLILPDVQNITKADAEELFKPLVSSVMNGETPPTDAKAFFVIVRKAIDSAEDMIKDELINEVSKYREGYNYRGIEFKIFNTGDRLDYSADPVIAELERRIESRKGLVKFANKNGEYVDALSGEVVSPVPLKSRSQVTIKTTLKG